jgi:hypothetical protein
MSILTVYPDAPGWSTISWYVQRTSVNETFANIGTWAWNGVWINNDDNWCAYLAASSTTNQFATLQRWIFTFSTSALTSSATISWAKFWLVWANKANWEWSAWVDLVASTPAANNTLANSDYSQLWTTVFATIGYSSLDIWWTNYNTWTLDANWISNISKTWISKFWTRLTWDTAWSFWWVWANGNVSWFDCYFSKYTWTTKDPKLVITYTTTSIKNINWLATVNIKSINWLALASIKSFNWLV